MSTSSISTGSPREICDLYNSAPNEEPLSPLTLPEERSYLQLALNHIQEELEQIQQIISEHPHDEEQQRIRCKESNLPFTLAKFDPVIRRDLTEAFVTSIQGKVQQAETCIQEIFKTKHTFSDSETLTEYVQKKLCEINIPIPFAFVQHEFTLEEAAEWLYGRKSTSSSINFFKCYRLFYQEQDAMEYAKTAIEKAHALPQEELPHHGLDSALLHLTADNLDHQKQALIKGLFLPASDFSISRPTKKRKKEMVYGFSATIMSLSSHKSPHTLARCEIENQIKEAGRRNPFRCFGKDPESLRSATNYHIIKNSKNVFETIQSTLQDVLSLKKQILKKIKKSLKPCSLQNVIFEILETNNLETSLATISPSLLDDKEKVYTLIDTGIETLYGKPKEETINFRPYLLKLIEFPKISQVLYGDTKLTPCPEAQGILLQFKNGSTTHYSALDLLYLHASCAILYAKKNVKETLYETQQTLLQGIYRAQNLPVSFLLIDPRLSTLDPQKKEDLDEAINEGYFVPIRWAKTNIFFTRTLIIV